MAEDSTHTYAHVLIGLAIGLLIGTCAGYFVGTWQMLQGFHYLEQQPSSSASSAGSSYATQPSAQSETQQSGTQSTNPLHDIRFNPFN